MKASPMKAKAMKAGFGVKRFMRGFSFGTFWLWGLGFEGYGFLTEILKALCTGQHGELYLDFLEDQALEESQRRFLPPGLAHEFSSGHCHT